MAGLHKAQPLGGVLQGCGHVAQAQPLEGGHERRVVRDHAKDRARQVAAAQQLLDLPAALALQFQPGNTPVTTASRFRLLGDSRDPTCGHARVEMDGGYIGVLAALSAQSY